MFQNACELVGANWSKTPMYESLPKDVADCTRHYRQKYGTQDEREFEKTVSGKIKQAEQDDRQKQDGDSIDGGAKSNRPFEPVEFSLNDNGIACRHLNGKRCLVNFLMSNN
jgi:hypothetical protein